MRVDGEGRRRRSPSVRARIVAAVLALAALGMTLAGGTAFVLQRERVDARLDDELVRSLTEFDTLVTDGVDPATGAPFTTTRAAMYTAMQREVPARNEGMLAVLDGRVALTAPSTVRLRLEDVDDVVRTALDAEGGTRARLHLLTAGGRSFRVLTIPARVGDDVDGVLVLGFDRTAEHTPLADTYRWFASVGLVSLVLLGAVAWAVAGRLLAPLRDLQATAQRISDTDLTERIPVRGDDDVSDLTRTVNSMLDRLEAAFASQRRMLDDAGHELRTPLTIVRGHLELVDLDDPEDVRSTRALVLDELDRMNLLVDDLMTLARVERPDFVRPVATDVGRLTDEVLDKARSLGDRRWSVEARADVVADVDPQRLTQAWLQLAGNAAKFSPEGTAVRLGSRVVHDHLVLSVHDEGPGVAPEDAERIFDRFARASAGRGVEGSGLGLPIVRAIAVAHGGWADVDLTAAHGARFVIEIPLVRTRVSEDDTATADHAAG